MELIRTLSIKNRDKKMKILYLTYGEQSGVVKQVTEHLSVIYKCSFNIVNIAKDVSFRYNKIKFPRISIFNFLNSLLAMYQFSNNWKHLYIRTDLAFINMSKKADQIIQNISNSDLIMQSGVLFAPSSKKINIPFVLGILDNTYRIGYLGKNREAGVQLSNRFVAEESRIYNLADLIFAMSHHVEDSLIKDYHINDSKIVVTGVGPNILPHACFLPTDYKYMSKKIVMIGLDFKRKGGHDLLSAFNKVRAVIEGAKLVVIGSVPFSGNQNVSFKGVLDREQIKKELEDANVYVMPSYREPFGIAFLEAMAFFTPCIGTRVEAIPEIIDDERTGFLVRPGDVDDLAEKIISVLSSPSLARSMGHEGRIKYESKYRWEVVADCIFSSLTNLCG